MASLSAYKAMESQLEEYFTVTGRIISVSYSVLILITVHWLTNIQIITARFGFSIVYRNLVYSYSQTRLIEFLQAVVYLSTGLAAQK